MVLEWADIPAVEKRASDHPAVEKRASIADGLPAVEKRADNLALPVPLALSRSASVDSVSSAPNFASPSNFQRQDESLMPLAVPDAGAFQFNLCYLPHGLTGVFVGSAIPHGYPSKNVPLSLPQVVVITPSPVTFFVPS